MGVADNSEWFVTIVVGKAYTRQYYPVPPFIPERFPPITELVKSWSSDQIRSELAKGSRTPLRSDREKIILTELAKRGMSTDLIVDLLREAAPGQEYGRLANLEAALKNSGHQDSARTYFE